MNNLKLTIELVPQSCWFSNVRDHISSDEWNIVKKDSYKKSNYKCEICGGKGEKHPVECHEIWEYDDKNKVQILKGLISLCPSCHQVKHIGYAQKTGNLDKAIEHFKKINKTSGKDSLNYIKNVFIIWNERSKYQWKLDIKWLNDHYNMNVQTKR